MSHQSLSRIAFELEQKIVVPPNQLSYLTNSRKTFVRWGDGETLAAKYTSLSFQKRSFRLAFEMHRVLATASRTDEFVIGLPLPFILGSLRQNIPDSRLKNWDATLRLLNKYLRSETVVLDSFLFRTTKGAGRTEPRRTLSELVGSLGQSSIGVVTSQSTVDLVTEELPIDFEPFVIPSVDAFSEISVLVPCVVRWAQRSSHEPVLLVSGGPAAKALAFRLRKHLWVIDVGQFFHG